MQHYLIFVTYSDFAQGFPSTWGSVSLPLFFLTLILLFRKLISADSLNL